MTAFAEFVRGPWRLRAVLCENQGVTGMPGYDDGSVLDVFLWFVGRMDEDEWFAQGVSDYFDDAAADEISGSFDGAHMDVLLAYGGVEWDEMEPNLHVEFGTTQRALASDIHPKMMEDLLKLSRTEIRALRDAEDAESAARRAQQWSSSN